MNDVALAEGSASGKVILFGEHAVVYGVPALAAGISRGVRATAERTLEDEIHVGGTQVPQGSDLLLGLGALRRALGVSEVRVTLNLELPAGAGLGASAAMGVACTRALASLFSLPLSDRQVFLAAQAWEKVFHGNPSGVDVAAALSTGVIRFTKTEEPQSVVLGAPLHLVIAQAGPPASTKEMVEEVARFKERNPIQFERSLSAIASLVENALLLLRSGDLRAVGKLMDLNHMLLAGWMLSTEELEHACSLSRQAGAFGAKLTGAGGGGCVLALVGRVGDPETSERATAVESALVAANIPAFSAVIGAHPPKRNEHA